MTRLRLLTLFLFLFSTYASATDYQTRFGLRLATGIGGYTAVNAKSGGFALPVLLEGSYSVTPALEVLLGARGVWSFAGDTPNISYALPYAATLGFRYYYNVQEVVKAFNTMQLFIGLDRLGIEVQSHWGIQWDTTPSLALFAQGGPSLLYGRRPDDPTRAEVNLALSFLLGAHYHF